MLLIIFGFFFFVYFGKSEPNNSLTLNGDGQEQLGITNQGFCQNQVIQGNSNIQICLTLADYRTSLRKEMQAIQAEFVKRPSKEELKFLIRRQEDISKKLLDIQGAYKSRISELHELIAKVDMLYDVVQSHSIEKVKRSLTMGQVGEALALLARSEDILSKRLPEIEREHKAALKVANQHKAAREKTVLAMANLAYEQGHIEEGELNYSSARKHYLRAIKFAPDNDVYMMATGKISSIMGLLDDAISYYEKVLESKRKSHGDSHLEVGEVYMELGKTLREKGTYVEAFEYLNKSLEIRQTHLGEKHSDVADTYHSIGGVWWEKGEHERALELFEQALEIYRKVFSEKHKRIADAYNNISLIMIDRGEFDKALEMLNKALKIRLAVLNKEHPDISDTYGNIGIVFKSKGFYKQAEVSYLREIEIKRKILGEIHPKLSVAYYNLANNFSVRGNVEQALKYYKKSLEIDTKIKGEDYIYNAYSYTGMGFVVMYENEYDKALKLFFKAKDIVEKRGEKSSFVLPYIYNGLGKALHGKSQYDKALEYCQKGSDFIIENYDDNNPFLISAYDCIGRVLTSQKKYKAAITMYGKALEIVQSVFGENQFEVDTARAYYGLAKALHLKGDKVKAKPHAQRACEIFSHQLGAEHHYTQPICRLVNKLER